MRMLLVQLRKCCNHPYLFPGSEPDFDGSSTGMHSHPVAMHACL